jgi:TonB-dependent SusC/RagA subfamily outer membrane receptor
MKVVSGSGPIPNGTLLFVPLTVLFLAACATTQLSEGGQPSDAETVEIGYGAVEKDHLAGSTTTHEGDAIHKGHPRTLAGMLSRIPGVRVIDMVEGGLTVRIRGSSSFLGGEEPLFVIDGMPIQSTDGALNTINPDTIESIRVLKNADATAIYGSRGANGVILIKTRRG